MLAHFDLDAFFASCEIRDHPELAGKPMVVAFVTPQGNHCNRGVVSAASYEVRKYGVRSGMSLWEAKKLCLNLVIISGNFAKYSKSSAKMYQIFNRYTPYVEPLSLDEAFLDFVGCEVIYPDLLKTCQQIKSDIKSEIGITASCGIASCKVVAKVASDFQKPDGLTFVPKGKEAEFLAPLSINKLYGVGPKIEAVLKQIGVETIGDLSSLPCQFLQAVFGKYGVTIWTWANGIDNRQVIPPPPAKSISKSTTFTKNSADLKFILANLLYLSENVSAALRTEKVVGRCVTVTVRYHNFLTQSHQKVFKHTIGSTKEVYSVSRHLLLECWDQKMLLRLIGVTVSDFEVQNQQLSLFIDFNKRRALESVLDQVRTKYGFWAIRPASLADLKTVKDKSDEDENVRLLKWGKPSDNK